MHAFLCRLLCPAAARWLVPLGVAVSLAACSESGSGSDVNTPIEPVEGTVGTQGGRVESEGAAIDVPAGALDADTTLSVESAASPAAPGGVTPVGPTIEIGPSGTTFAVPATVTVPYNAAALPPPRGDADIRIYTADDVGGTYTSLATTVDASQQTASAQVDHLSVFVAGVADVVGPVEGADPPACEREETCGCEAVWAARPLDVMGRVDLERRIRFMCYDDAADELTVLSFTVVDNGGFPEPDEYFISVHDGETLAVLSEETTTETILESGGECGPLPTRQGIILGEPPFRAGADRDAGISWTVRFEDLGDWTEAILEITSGPDAIDISFNRHLNEPQPVDTDPFYDESTGLEGRVLDDGSARFYLHSWRNFHVDVIHIDDLQAVVTGPEAFVDTDGNIQPSARERIVLQEGSTNSVYSFDPIHLLPDPEQPDADRIIAFSAIVGLRVERSDAGIEVEELFAFDPPPNPAYSGWQNGGLDDSGLLYAQSQFASFSNGYVVVLDPETLTVTAEWEIGCLDAPTVSGFHVYPSGLMLRFADFDIHAVELIRNGRLEAFGDVPFGGNPVWLGRDESVGRLYVADDLNGEVSAIRLPQ